MTTPTNKAKRAVVTILECEVVVDGFLTPEGEYVMSQSQVGEIVNVDRSTVLRFFREKQPEPLFDERSLVLQIYAETGFKNSDGIIKAITLDLATDFWYAQAFKGNKKAQALVKALGKETLQRRFDLAFNQQRTEEEYLQQTTNLFQQEWEEIREYSVFRHHSFSLACKTYMFDAAKVHDLITVGVCGKTASELREDELVGKTPRIGLDHIKNKEALKAIADVKLKFSSFRVGTAQERVEKALKIVLKGKKFGAS